MTRPDDEQVIQAVTLPLFQIGGMDQGIAEREELCPGAVLLRGFALSRQNGILDALHVVTAETPFRHMITPGGFRTSVALTNCVPAAGYRTRRDIATMPWTLKAASPGVHAGGFAQA